MYRPSNYYQSIYQIRGQFCHSPCQGAKHGNTTEPRSEKQPTSAIEEHLARITVDISITIADLHSLFGIRDWQNEDNLLLISDLVP